MCVYTYEAYIGFMCVSMYIYIHTRLLIDDPIHPHDPMYTYTHKTLIDAPHRFPPPHPQTNKPQEFTKSRMELLACALEDAVGYLNRGGEVAILDGTNVTKARRHLIIERLKKEVGMSVCPPCVRLALLCVGGAPVS